MSVTIPADDFVRCVMSVLPCASTDMTLPALVAVNVSWDGTEVTFRTTNRYVAAVQALPYAAPEDYVCGSISIPVATVKNALSVIKATTVPGRMPAAVTIDVDLRTVLGIPFEDVGEFPKIDSLFPKATAPAESMIINPAYLALLAGPKIKGRVPTLEFALAGPVKPITVTRQGDDTFRGLLMPCRPGVAA